jgi:CBS domain containing-hemolysin-like protein
MPVYEKVEEDPDDRTAILGFLMIRQLILIDWDHGRKLSTLPLQRPDCVSPRMNLVDALELLRTGGTLMVRHMYAIHS